MVDIVVNPMLQWVLERCDKATSPTAVVLCTDIYELVSLFFSWGFDAILTGTTCASGSERIASLVDQLLVRAGSCKAFSTVVINVQGDQPFIDPAVIDMMSTEFSRRFPSPAKAKATREKAIEAAKEAGLGPPDLEPLTAEAMPRRALARKADGTPTSKTQRNFTDADSHLMKSDGHYIQGYNW